LKDRHAITPNLINDSIAIKTRIVEDDFLDLGVRRRLNFGHTIGHAIEANSLRINEENEALSHGISVALGMVVESYISHKITGFSAGQLNEVSTVLSGLVKSVYEEIPEVSELMPYLIRDKKNYNNTINCTLLKEIGEANHDYEVEEDLIKKGLAYLKSLK
jgi:3-dehydroquinate synthase